jgi:lipoate-protein ligase A
MIIGNIDIICEKRKANQATEYDIRHLNDKRNKIIFFNTDKPMLAIGREQSKKNIKVEECKKDGVEIVNKITNGTAVLVNDTETIATIMFNKELVREKYRSTTRIFATVNKVINMSLNNLGIDSYMAKKSSKHQYKPVGCFNAIVKNDILYNDRKLVGTAFTEYNDMYIGHMLIYMDKTYDNACKYFNCCEKEKVPPISIKEIKECISKEMLKIKISCSIRKELCQVI